MTRWINAALKASKAARHPKYSLGVVVVKGGRLLSRAANLGRPAHWRFPKRGSHAEKRALRPHLCDFTGATIYVVRSDGGMSRPCDDCMNLIREAKISRIFYFDWDGKVVSERVNP